MPAEWELTDELSDEEVFMIETPWSMYFYGVAHRDGADAEVVFYTLEADILPYFFTLTRRYSNNMTEYQALILGLETTINMKHLYVRIYGDSKLVVNQLFGIFDIKKTELIPYYKYARQLMGYFDNVTIEHISRKFNQQVNSLARLASMITLSSYQNQISIYQNWVISSIFDEEDNGGEENVYHIFVHEIEKEDWRHLIIDYLNHGKLLEEPKKRVNIHRQAPYFNYYKGTLYRKSFDRVFLQYFGENETMQTMEEAHSGICGAHQSGPKLHFHIKRMGYY
ncbi:uncharacterized protein [Coffea arabica]|uniref:RNase H type-1 domain-containing protein n=1 Tax=Coffea arabica TaxID=13443 RepID=A0ABM4W2M4_COFAR